MKNNFILKCSTLLLFSFVLFSCNNNAQQPSFTEPEKITNTFFSKYEHNTPAIALDFLFSTNSDTALLNQVPDLKNSLSSHLPSLGKYFGKEIITKKQIGESFILHSYMVKYDKQPIRFTFIFYNPNGNWKIYKFEFDTELENELEDAGRIYFLK